MGLIYSGIPIPLVTRIIGAFQVKYFVETGTYFADTAYWASSRFERVFTIEASQILWQQAVDKYGRVNNIEFLKGDSRDKLRDILDRIHSPAIFWLDAHWSGGITYGEGNECPLIDELQIINSCRVNHFILIDDARCFLSPPPLPHSADRWPDIAAVISALTSEKRNRFVVVIEDVVVLLCPLEGGK